MQIRTITTMDKIRGVIKKWRKFAKVGIGSCSCSPGSCPPSNMENEMAPPCGHASSAAKKSIPKGCVALYVGKSRRRYTLPLENIDHPIMKTLIQKSEEDHDEGGYRVACEVVLFEHLLWMLANGDSLLSQTDSLEELVDLYTS